MYSRTTTNKMHRNNKAAVEAGKRQRVNEAAQEELNRMNESVQSGKTVLVKTFLGNYVLDYVDNDWWYHTHPQGQTSSWMNQRSWCGCNDGDWAEMMKQAGLDRNYLWRHLQ
jgi:hypothetical protein